MQNPLSAEDQLRMGAELAEKRLWKVVGRFKDEARTGRTMVRRTGLHDALAMAETGGCDVLVVEDISRIARNAADMLGIARRLGELDVVIYTFAGGVMGGIELTIRAYMAEEQSRENGLRVNRGHKSAALKGRVIGGVAYGYRLLKEPDEHGNLREIDSDEERVVLRIYNDLYAGISPHAICAALNREGVAPPGGGKLWRPKSITGDKRLMTGIGRNPLYAGKLMFGKSQSELITSTGKVKVTPGQASDLTIVDVPHLQIVPPELWQAVQEILDERSTTVPNNSRKPTYVLSSLVKCDCCGESFSMVGEGMGCSGRRYGNGCTNRRRVCREDLEKAVLSGLAERVLKPELLEIYLAEYRRELATAAQEHASRTETASSRLREIDREMDNVMAQVKAGAEGYAKQRLNEELQALGAERRRIEKESRQGPPTAPLALDCKSVVNRLKELLEDLGRSLNGPERDAARSRDIIRSFIKEIRIRPIDGPGKADGRGSGPVRVLVEGELNALLDHAHEDRVIQRRGTNAATLGLGTVAFTYYFDLTPKNSASANALMADVAVVSQLLDDAYAPVKNRDAAEALAGQVVFTLPIEDQQVLDLRVRRIIHFLKGSGAIRPVRLSYGEAGWVWEDRPVSNERWQARANEPNPPQPPYGVIRMGAPTASVVRLKQVGPRESGD